MLEPILEDTRRRIERLPPVDVLRERARTAPPVRGFGGALAGPGLSVIAEVKRRSPSRGELAADLDPADRAGRYAAGGASAISVLTEPDHFSGSDEDLVRARKAAGIPILRKDFTLDPRQIWEARAIGADAILLIVAALDQDVLVELLGTAEEVGLDVLVEVHDEDEAERALDAGAVIVGVNNRDLTTFDVDLATAERIAPMLEGVRVRVAESGIFDGSDARRMEAVGFDAVLVGEALVRADDPEGLIRSLRGGESGPTGR